MSKVYSVCLSKEEGIQFIEHLKLRKRMNRKTTPSGLIREAVELRQSILCDEDLRKRYAWEELQRIDWRYRNEEARIETEIRIWERRNTQNRGKVRESAESVVRIWRQPIAHNEV